MKDPKRKSCCGLSLKLNKKFFYVLLTAVAVVLVWRSVWGLADMYLFPDNLLLSYITGLIVGIFLLYLPDRDIDELF